MVDPLLEALRDQRPVLYDLHEGGWLSWSSTYNALHSVEPLLVELGWRAWSWMIEELNSGPDLSSLPPDYPQPWVFEPS